MKITITAIITTTQVIPTIPTTIQTKRAVEMVRINSLSRILNHLESFPSLLMLFPSNLLSSIPNGFPHTMLTSLGASALDLLTRETDRNPIITFNSEIDEMLGGGVPIGKITELCKRCSFSRPFSFFLC